MDINQGITEIYTFDAMLESAAEISLVSIPSNKTRGIIR